MAAGKFVADFIAANLDRIYKLGVLTYGKVDDTLKLKLRMAYDEYLERARNKYSKSKSFFIRDRPVDLYQYYVPTGISCGKVSILKPKFYSCINESDRIVVTGTGGTGKSVLIKHLFLDCIRDKNYVPVLVELRDLNGKNINLTDFIYSTLVNFGFQMSQDFVNNAMGEGHFCFFFDGYDELEPSLRQVVMESIQVLSDKYVGCPIFISSRPDDVFNGIEDFSIFKMSPLNLASASELVLKLPYDDEIKTRFISDMHGGMFIQHKSFLSNPLLLSIMLLTYGVNAEIPSKLSVFYNQAYEALFQRHDANKSGYLRNRRTKLDIQDFSKVFALFSVLTLDKRQFSMSRTECLQYISRSRDKLGQEFRAEDYLSDLLSAACLLIEDGIEIAYSHRSFQEYFAAVYISTADPKIQQRLIKSFWVGAKSDSVMFLLYELNSELVERVLIVPELEELFNLLGVTDKVEPVHVLNYIKLACNTIRLDRGSFISAGGVSYLVHKTPLSIVDFAMTNAAKIYQPDEKGYQSLARMLLDKYGNSKDFLAFDTGDANVDDPIIVDIISSNIEYSISYIGSVYELYLRLKNKHENQEDDFDAFLSM